MKKIFMIVPAIAIVMLAWKKISKKPTRLGLIKYNRAFDLALIYSYKEELRVVIGYKEEEIKNIDIQLNNINNVDIDWIVITKNEKDGTYFAIVKQKDDTCKSGRIDVEIGDQVKS